MRLWPRKTKIVQMVVVQRTCIVCSETYEIKVPKQSYELWIIEGYGLNIAWPDATDDQREELQSGIHSPKCWNKIFGEDDELFVAGEF